MGITKVYHLCMYLGKVRVTQSMASIHETQRFDPKGDAGSVPAVLSDKSGPEACNSNTQCGNNDITSDSKWKFRPPPRGLTPNEYVLCPE